MLAYRILGVICKGVALRMSHGSRVDYYEK